MSPVVRCATVATASNRCPAVRCRCSVRRLPRTRVAERRPEHGRGSGRCLPGDRQPRVVRANPNVAQCTLNSPRQRVIQSTPLCHSPNHIAPAWSVHRSAPCLLDGSRLRRVAGGPYCAARSAGSDPPKPAVLRRNGRSCVTPIARGRSRRIVPSGKGGEPAVAVLRSARFASARGRRRNRISAASSRPRVRPDTWPSRS